MIKTLLDLLQFLFTNAQLLTSALILTLLSIYLSKTIKQNSKTFYFILSIPFLLFTIPFILRLSGVDIINLATVPVLGHIVRDYMLWGTFGHPLFIVVMYMGALDPKLSFVKKLKYIRKELAIVGGFPVFTHLLWRIFNNFPNAWQFFTDNESFVENNQVESLLGATLVNFSFVFGVLMFLVFLPLWITSFDIVRKRMSVFTWKKIHKLAYVFYAAMFIHAMGISVGGILNTPPSSPRQTIEIQATGSLPTSITDYRLPLQTRRYIQVASLLLIYGSYVVLRVRKSRKDKKRKSDKKIALSENRLE